MTKSLLIYFCAYLAVLKQNRKLLLTIFCGISIIFASLPAEAVSVYGMPLAKAYSKDFFQFFRFRVVGVSITKDGFMEIVFKPPKGNPTRTSVKLHVVLKKDGQIKRMQLQLGRRFINDLKQGMFARDVAKSFIQAGVHEDDYAAARPLVNEIFFRQKLTPIVLGGEASGSKKFKGTISIFKLGTGKLTSGDIIIIGDGGKIPKLPEKQSEVYRCFTGKIQTSKIVFTKSSIHLENTKLDGNKVLLITIGSKDYVKFEGEDQFDFHSIPLFVP